MYVPGICTLCPSKYEPLVPSNIEPSCPDGSVSVSVLYQLSSTTSNIKRTFDLEVYFIFHAYFYMFMSLKNWIDPSPFLLPCISVHKSMSKLRTTKNKNEKSTGYSLVLQALPIYLIGLVIRQKAGDLHLAVGRPAHNSLWIYMYIFNMVLYPRRTFKNDPWRSFFACYG